MSKQKYLAPGEKHPYELGMHKQKPSKCRKKQIERKNGKKVLSVLELQICSWRRIMHGAGEKTLLPRLIIVM